MESLWQGQLSDSITAITTSADRWAASSAAGEVVVWQNSALNYYQSAGNCSINCLTYSADGHYLAASGQAGTVQIWRAGAPWQTIIHQRVWIDRLSWHPHLPVLAVAVGKLVQLWQVDTRELLATLPFDRSSIFDLSWHPTGSHLAVAGYGGVAVWPWPQLQQYELLTVATSAHWVAWSQDGSFLAAATLDRQLTIAASQELEKPWIISDLPAKISQIRWFTTVPALAIISDGELICCQYADENWHPRSWPATRNMAIATHPQLPILVVIDQDGVMSLQDTDLTILGRLEQPDTSQALDHLVDRAILQWSEGGEHLVLGNSCGQLSWWSIVL